MDAAAADMGIVLQVFTSETRIIFRSATRCISRLKVDSTH